MYIWCQLQQLSLIGTRLHKAVFQISLSMTWSRRFVESPKKLKSRIFLSCLVPSEVATLKLKCFRINEDTPG